jgi:environmental stress-induced protein Ves
MNPIRSVVLPASGHHDMPWKNGLGRTAEIARFPDGDDAFAWRLSIATIACDGPFSAFPECDRTLIPLSGGGVLLEFEGGETIQGELYEPMRFSGDRPALGRLLGAGATRDLNVITRRPMARHHAGVRRLDGAIERCDLVADITFVVGLTGETQIGGLAQGEIRLGAADALRLDGRNGRITLGCRAGQPARAAVVEIMLGA